MYMMLLITHTQQMQIILQETLFHCLDHQRSSPVHFHSKVPNVEDPALHVHAVQDTHTMEHQCKQH